jgi:sugar/nucleoside kinase (ribokinase family)
VSGAPDLVAVGWVTLDRVDGEVRPGGAAYYAAVTAARHGLRVGVLTSHGPDFPAAALPPEVEAASVRSERTAAFRIDADGPARRLAVEAIASPLRRADLPDSWRGAPLAMLCPIAGEVDPALAAVFRDASVAVLPQGWMREIGAAGVVRPAAWRQPQRVLAHVQFLALSHEDIGPFEMEAR